MTLTTHQNAPIENDSNPETLIDEVLQSIQTATTWFNLAQKINSQAQQVWSNSSEILKASLSSILAARPEEV